VLERQEVKDGIARRAYEIYVQRGGQNGQDVEDSFYEEFHTYFAATLANCYEN
jgi:hypothetical protein